MKTSCIQPPKNNRYIQLHQWQVDFCEGKHCAALLLSFFSGWHDWKIIHDDYYRRVNDIAEMHGDGRVNSENAFLFFSIEQFIDGCMGLFARKAINSGLEILVKLGVISIHKNPNIRYGFDKTRYFRFYPEVCNQWLMKDYSLNQNQVKNPQPADNSDVAKRPDALCQKELRSSQKAARSDQKAEYICTNTTNNTTNKNDSINARETIFVEQPKTQPLNEEEVVIQSVTDALIEQGMPAKHFNYPDVAKIIQVLCLAGATVDDFIAAFHHAKKFAERGFGVKYLVPIVELNLVQRKKASSYAVRSYRQKTSASLHTKIDYGKSSPLPQWAID